MDKPLPIMPLSCIDSLPDEGSLLVALDDEGPIDYLIELIEALRQGLQPSDAAVDWLEHGTRQYLTGTEKHLSIALGLTKSTRQEYCIKMQRLHLRDAWVLVHCEKNDQSARAAALQNEIARLESRWNDFGQLDEPDPSWHKLRKTLWRARQFGPLPQVRQLLKVARNENFQA